MWVRQIALFGLCVLAVAPALAQRTTTVRGYMRKDGTYVPPHVRTAPNNTRLDNWSTRGNINPYTGREGTKDPYNPYRSMPRTSPYFGTSQPQEEGDGE